MILAGVLACSAAADPVTLTLREDAGATTRRAAPLSLETALPAGLLSAQTLEATLLDAAGHPTGIPVDAFSRAGLLELYWVEPNLPAGSSTVRRVVIKEATPRAASLSGDFHFVDGQGWRDLVLGDQPVWRRMFAFDPARHEETYKPYLHLYGFHDDRFITKASGGLYSSQRGISLGWEQVKAAGKVHDFWHGDGVFQRQTGFQGDRERAGKVVGRDCATTDWVVAGGKAILRDAREFTTWRTRPGEIVIDMMLTLEALGGPVSLSTDPLHGSLVFRASSEVQQHAVNTLAWHSAGAKALGNDVWDQAQWASIVITTDEGTYAVTAMTRGENPGGTLFAMRDFGKLSACFNATVNEGQPLRATYRWIIQDAARVQPQPADLELSYEDFSHPVTVTFE